MSGYKGNLTGYQAGFLRMFQNKNKMADEVKDDGLKVWYEKGDFSSTFSSV